MLLWVLADACMPEHIWHLAIPVRLVWRWNEFAMSSMAKSVTSSMGKNLWRMMSGSQLWQLAT